MRRGFWLAALLPMLNGCYIPPDNGGYGYGQPGYPPGGYGQPEYVQPGYGQPAYDPYAAYPGYGEYNGVPSMMESGVSVPLVLFGGEWGFYDSGRRWHRAPEGISRHMEERQRGGGGFHSNEGPRGGGGFHSNEAPRGGGFGQPRQEGRPGGERFGGPAAFRPAEPQRSMQQAAPVHSAPSPAAAAPAAQPRGPEHERTRGCPTGHNC
jgi:hypothetical protein